MSDVVDDVMNRFRKMVRTAEPDEIDRLFAKFAPMNVLPHDAEQMAKIHANCRAMGRGEERERCARICDEYFVEMERESEYDAKWTAQELAKRIRGQRA